MKLKEIDGLMLPKKEEYTTDFSKGNRYNHTTDGKRFYAIDEAMVFNQVLDDQGEVEIELDKRKARETIRELGTPDILDDAMIQDIVNVISEDLPKLLVVRKGKIDG